MRRRLALTSALLASTIVVLAQPPARAPQTFRSGTEVVFVDVSVRDGDRAVTGLTADDFDLTDNGVRQRVESVEPTAVPIDLTLVVDVSGNPGRPWTKRMRRTQVTATIDRELADVVALLRQTDRLRLFAIDTRVQQVFPFTARDAIVPVGDLDFDGLSGLYDTLATALLHPSEPARRHVIVARTKGRDTISALTSDAVRAMAAQSDALLHPVVMETVFSNEVALDGFQCSRNLMGICAPTRRSWVPYREHLFSIGELRRLLPPGLTIAAAAEATGGRLHRTEVITEPTLTGTFKRVFEDFRRGYMLRYTPQGVGRSGWHKIEVKVHRPKTYTVRARNGYGVDEPPPSPPPPVPVAEPRTVPELIRAYELAAYSNMAGALRDTDELAPLIRTFDRGGNPWPASPNRESAFALELAEPAIFSRDRDDREAGYGLLQRFTQLVRDPLEPGLFERYWHFAVLTMLEGSIRPATADAFVTRALARFPDEPRFVLSRAIITDQRWAVQGVTSVTGPDGMPTPDHAKEVRQHYEAAIKLTDVAAEARVRFAWFLHRIGRHGEAVLHLNQAAKEPIRDPSVRYLRQLFLGHVLLALKEHAMASAAFTAASVDAPGAQSAKVALMNLALLRDDRQKAEAFAEEIQSQGTHTSDPWWGYWQGQHRLYPAALQRLREMAR